MHRSWNTSFAVTHALQHFASFRTSFLFLLHNNYSLYAPNVTVYNGTFDGSTLRGVDAVIQLKKNMRLAFPNGTITPEYASIDSTGTQLFVRSSWQGKNSGALWWGQGATGRDVKLYNFMQIQQNNNGKIEKVWFFTDRASFLNQLGLINLTQFCASCQQGGATAAQCTHAQPGATGAFPPTQAPMGTAPGAAYPQQQQQRM